MGEISGAWTSGKITAGGAVTATAIDSSLWASGQTITVDGNFGDWGRAFVRNRPETNLEWLDKRINEMRVSL